MNTRRTECCSHLALAALLCAPPFLNQARATDHGHDRSDQMPLGDRYRETAGRLIGASLVSDHAYSRLAYLCDRFGHRISGSNTLEAAIDWVGEEMRKDGLANVHEEEVMVPAWIRGEERAWLTAPTRHDLNILGLGMSVGTTQGGIDAEVIVVPNFDRVDELGEDGIKGKIVLYDVPFTSYGETVRFRSKGASRAAVHGAVGALVRSVGPISYDTPHTGALSYTDDVPKIPAAAVTIEAAAMMHRMQRRGETIRMHLEMGARQAEDRPSANVMGDVVGREWPDEVVVLGGHIDSWDVGQGAQDDGSGCIIAWEAVRLIKELGIRPRRTIRAALFTNEENGLGGGKDYAKRHAAALRGHVAAIESDSGNGLAQGFRFQVPPVSAEDEPDRKKARAEACDRPIAKDIQAILDSIAPLLEPLGATQMTCGGSGADVGPMVGEGVVGLGLDHDTSEYFHIHHTRADTFDKIDKVDLNKNVAAMAVMAFVLADMPGRLIEPEMQTTADQP